MNDILTSIIDRASYNRIKLYARKTKYMILKNKKTEEIAIIYIEIYVNG